MRTGNQHIGLLETVGGEIPAPLVSTTHFGNARLVALDRCLRRLLGDTRDAGCDRLGKLGHHDCSSFGCGSIPSSVESFF